MISRYCQSVSKNTAQFSDYGIPPSSPRQNEVRFQRRKSQAKEVHPIKKNLDSQGLNFAIFSKKTIKNGGCSSQEKRFVRSRSNLRGLNHISSTTSIQCPQQIEAPRKISSDYFHFEKGIIDLKSSQEKIMDSHFKKKLQQLEKMQQLKQVNKKLTRQIALLNHQLYLKNVNLGELQRQVKSLSQKIKSINLSNKENMNYFLQPCSIIKNEVDTLKEKEYEKFSISTKQEMEKNIELSTKNKPRVEIQTDVIVSNLHKTIQYLQTQIYMLKKNKYDIEQVQIQCLLFKRQNKALKQQIKRLKSNLYGIPNKFKQKNSFLAQSSISLQFSKSFQGKQH